jgi:hypothetical protein
MSTAVIWAIWIMTSFNGIPIPVSYHATEAGCKATLAYVRKLAPDKKVECLPGDYAAPPEKQKGSAAL